MPSRRVHLLTAALLIFTTRLPFAQDATVMGTVMDETKGVLPGVSVAAINLATAPSNASVQTKSATNVLGTSSASGSPGRARR